MVMVFLYFKAMILVDFHECDTTINSREVLWNFDKVMAGVTTWLKSFVFHNILHPLSADHTQEQSDGRWLINHYIAHIWQWVISISFQQWRQGSLHSALILMPNYMLMWSSGWNCRGPDFYRDCIEKFVSQCGALIWMGIMQKNTLRV